MTWIWPTRRLVVPAAALALSFAASVAPAAEVPAAGTKVVMTPARGSGVLKVVTPAKAVHGGKLFRITGASGPLAVGGSSVLFGVRYLQATNAFYGAMDLNGNGKLDAREYVKFSTSRSATYNVKIDGQAYAIRVADVRVGTRAGGGITMVYGGYIVLTYFQGNFAGTTVRLYDDNADGKLTQDGQDAISFGRSTFALPLGKVHQIGQHHWQLDVAADGLSITFAPAGELELGIVELPYRRGLKVLALTDDQGRSYDLLTSGRTGIPAGSYHLRYGVLTAGKLMTVIAPTDACPAYDIQAGKINTLRLGKPIRVSFRATYTGGNLRVSPQVQVFGAGGEEYSFDFSGGTGRPHVLLMAGSKLLQDIPMKYG